MTKIQILLLIIENIKILSIENHEIETIEILSTTFVIDREP